MFYNFCLKLPYWAINFVYSSKFISWLIKHELKMDECGVQDSKWLELILLSINRAAVCCLAQAGPRRDFWNSGHCIGSRISPTWINLRKLIYSLPDSAVMSHFHWHMMFLIGVLNISSLIIAAICMYYVRESCFHFSSSWNYLHCFLSLFC